MGDALDDNFDVSDSEQGIGPRDDQPKSKSSSASSKTQNDKASQENKRRKRQLSRERTRQKKDIATLSGLNNPDFHFGQYPEDVQANYLTSVIKKHSPNLSPLEYREYPLSTEHLLNVESTWSTLLSGKTGSKSADIGMSRFIQGALAATIDESLRPPSTACNRLHGAPAILVITADAGRAATLCIELSNILDQASKNETAPLPKSKKAKVEHKNGGASSVPSSAEKGGSSNKLKPAKLFGRHFKVDGQRAYLQSSSAPIAVGTPARIRALLDPPSEAEKPKPGEPKHEATLNLDHLEYVVLDVSFRDKRGRNLFESDDARPETLPLLAELWKRRQQRAAQDNKNKKKDVKDEEGQKKRKADSGEGRQGRITSLKNWLVMF
ncbi:hypothetical protein CF319_g5963 [Tilletia indica]|nr:hypothetical protein CF319_g5963 [Tilletia indica]